MKIFLLFFLLFFYGCNNDVLEEKQVVNQFEKSKVEQNALEKRNLELFKKNWNLEQFLNTFFFERDFHNFSLDDSLIVFYGNDNVFIYSVSKEQMWSMRCGVLENLSKKQTDEISRLLSLYIKQLESLNLKGETWPALAIWKSRSPGKIKAYDVGYENPSQRIVIEKYFVESVFVHGCKRHVL